MPSKKASLQKVLEEIRLMRRKQEEDKFVSRIDMLFSVLISLTIFMSGIIINNSFGQNYINRPLLFFGISILVIFICTLIGEYIAIIQDNLTLRFDFWSILIIGIIQVIIREFLMYIMAFYPTYTLVDPTLYYYFPTYTLVFILVPFCLMKLNQRYIRRFSIRKKEVDKRDFHFFLLLTLMMASVIRIPDFFIILFLR